jgi:hypothetical protein
MSQQDATGHVTPDLESIESSAQALADSIPNSVNSYDLTGIKSRMQLVAQQIRDVRRYQNGESSIAAEMTDIHTKMEGMQKEINDYFDKRKLWAGMIPLILVVAAIVIYPFKAWSLIWLPRASFSIWLQ